MSAVRERTCIFTVQNPEENLADRSEGYQREGKGTLSPGGEWVKSVDTIQTTCDRMDLA